MMSHNKFTRREFLKSSLAASLGIAAGSMSLSHFGCGTDKGFPVVSLARIRNGNIGAAVEEAIDLLGGMRSLTQGKERIMLKPNLVGPLPEATTNREVIGALARLMQKEGKEVLIGEGSAAAPPFNMEGAEVFRTKKRDVLDKMQAFVFEALDYDDLAGELDVPLINLHSGDLVDVEIPGGFVFDRISLHRQLTEIDMLCSVPMMKTHSLAHVTLGMKNLIGLYPGTVYYTVRGHMHDLAAEVEPSGTASAIVDMVRANKLGLTVIDASSAMEGEGPTGGNTFKMNLIIAGTNPLATDMVGASIMGFEPEEIPTFTWAQKAGMAPKGLEGIEIRGADLASVRRKFARPTVYAWNDIRKLWGFKEV